MVIIGKINNEEITFHSIEKLEGFERFNEITYLSCNYCGLTEIPKLPTSLRVFNCYVNQIKEIKNLPKFLREFYCYSNPIANLMEIEKWKYICKKNRERDGYIKEHFLISIVGIELGGSVSSLLIPPVGDTLGSLLYL